MPRFYFRVCDGDLFDEDEEGEELPDLEAARRAAIRHGRSIMAADVQRGFLDLSLFIEIEDSDRRLVDTLGFEEAVDLAERRPRPPPRR